MTTKTEPVRPATRALQALGRFPTEQAASMEAVKAYHTLIEALETPLTMAEADILLSLTGADSFFGLIWPLVHMIEASPGWPDMEILARYESECAELMRDRIENSRRSQVARVDRAE